MQTIRVFIVHMLIAVALQYLKAAAKINKKAVWNALTKVITVDMKVSGPSGEHSFSIWPWVSMGIGGGEGER